MALFDRFWKGSRTGAPDGTGTPAGFFPTYESNRPVDDDEDDFGGFDPPRPRASANPTFDDWDAKLGLVDEALAATEKKRLKWWQRDYWRQRSKLWWTGRGALATFAVLALLIGWLTVTAPLSKSLEPIAPEDEPDPVSDIVGDRWDADTAETDEAVEAPVLVAVLHPAERHPEHQGAQLQPPELGFGQGAHAPRRLVQLRLRDVRQIAAVPALRAVTFRTGLRTGGGYRSYP